MLWKSQKAADLLRDHRILVHSIVTSREGEPGEVKLRGRAIPIDDAVTVPTHVATHRYQGMTVNLGQIFDHRWVFAS
jgi:hypothetical protein